MFYKVIYNNDKEMIVSNKNSVEEAERMVRLTKGKNVIINEIREFDYDLKNREVVYTDEK